MLIKYRPEIDGLRAIAVLSVVFYHADFIFNGHNPIPGGFLGVDVFFVISGYLITSIILREVEQGSFSYLSFYERRARRILPALFLVMLATIPFAWNTLLPDAMLDYSSSALSSLFMVSNYTFAYADSYWGEPSALKPLLHTWSLSVEEQFYVFFPIFILILWRTAKKSIFKVMALLFFVSLIYAEYMRRTNPEFAFFLLPSRGWELMAGALLAKGKGFSFLKNIPLKKLMPCIGMAMVIIPIFMFSKNTPHPSLLTLIPVLGTVILIQFANQEELIGRALSAKPVVAIGLISYSLYLWHFPVFAFDRIINGELTLQDKLINILASLILATLSYFLIEKTTRNKNITSKTVFFSLVSISFVVLLTFNIQVIRTDGYESRFVDFSKLVKYLNYDFKEDFLSHKCFLHKEDMLLDEPFSKCEYNAESGNKPTLMLWGDSNAAHLVPGIRKVYQNEYDLLIRTSTGCGAFIGLEVRARPNCREITDDILKLAIKTKPQKLIIAGLWKIEFPPLLEKTLMALLDAGVSNIEIIGPAPRWKHSLPQALINYGKTKKQTRALPKYLTDPTHQKIFEIEAALKAMTKNLDVKYTSILDLVCKPKLGCLTHTDSDNSLIQWDYGHLTSSGSIYIMQQIKKQQE